MGIWFVCGVSQTMAHARTLECSVWTCALSFCFSSAVNWWLYRRPAKSVCGTQWRSIGKYRIWSRFCRSTQLVPSCCWVAIMDQFIISVSIRNSLATCIYIVYTNDNRYAEISASDEGQRFTCDWAVPRSLQRPYHRNIRLFDTENHK